mgnify:CR=1 FL=1
MIECEVVFDSEEPWGLYDKMINSKNGVNCRCVV